jgi:PAS domain S-box-containing protein
VSPFNNPVLVRAILLLFFPAAAIALGVVLLRTLRRSFEADASLPEPSLRASQGAPLDLYHTVIQELKQQKHELTVLKQTEQRRTRAVENLNQAVFTNLPSGVVVFDTNGNVKLANPAARNLLGYASITGLSAEELFGGANPASASALEEARSAEGDSTSPADLVRIVLQERAPRRLQMQHRTPAGLVRHFGITLSQIRGADDSSLGAACLIDDLSEFESIRKQQQLHGQISAELALDLRTSLATIAGYAQQLAANRDPDLSRQLAEDISAEAARLDRHIGGFLSGRNSLATNSAAAGAAS